MSLKVLLAGTGAAAALFAMGPATADTPAGLEADFERICLPMRSTADAADNARAAGYVTAPAEIRKRMRGFPNTGEILWRAEEGRMTIFLAASQRQRSDGPFGNANTADLCGVASVPKQPGLQRKVQQMLGVGALQAIGRTSAFIYEQTPEGRVRLNPHNPALPSKAEAGVVRLATTRNLRDMSVAMMITPRQEDR